jgi:hypothetical protein
MDVKDRLACIAAGVDDHPVAGLIESALARQVRRYRMQMADHGLVLGRHGIERLDVLSRDDNEMRGGSGPDVFKRHRRLILVDILGRRFVPRNLAKKTVHRGVGHRLILHEGPSLRPATSFGNGTAHRSELEAFLSPRERGSYIFSHRFPTLAPSRKERGTELRWGYILPPLRA